MRKALFSLNKEILSSSDTIDANVAFKLTSHPQESSYCSKNVFITLVKNLLNALL